jgi:hypothetical protein
MTARTLQFSVTAPGANWISGLANNTWREIKGATWDTKLSARMPSTEPRGASAPQGKQDAWNGWCIDTRTSDVYSVGQGGHDDYWGNEVERIRLTDAAPAWSQLVAPTVSASVTSDQNYYSDGKPASTHGYYSSLVIPSINRAVRFPGGSKSKLGNGLNAITAFNIATGAYDAAGLWPGTLSFNTGGASFAMHPTTEAVYAWHINSSIRRWTAGVPGTWAVVAGVPSTPEVYYSAAACDPTRGSAGQILFLGGGGAGNVRHLYDIALGTVTPITLTGTDITAFSGYLNGGFGLVYVPASAAAGAAGDKYYACTPATSGSSVYVITPGTWACSLLATTGGTAIPETIGVLGGSRPFTKFLYVPALGGCVFGPRWGSNLWFLRLFQP